MSFYNYDYGRLSYLSRLQAATAEVGVNGEKRESDIRPVANEEGND